MTQRKALSPTQAQILATAAQHSAQLAEAPSNLPATARNSVFQSMLRAGLLEEMPAPNGGMPKMLRITAAGLATIGEPSVAEAGGEGTQVDVEGQQASTNAQETQAPPVASATPPLTRTTLREAATALLVAWDAGVERSALPVPH
ncbi:MarR family winged helix-turn-helix transcriptional regulator [Roseomonas populi]|uniref:MarR family winged helix-turn-helix transcriptional regulator n=1 Tax=Roseomonas populi TaxID=3121582 RepID=A0ABT1XCP7_9PROT|nr:MarR family winged helix-turn-helix transcriptional regulator [Roseomonas pecuniae]MCR0985739.1 MarR family winged helix-turn-helix transcriptional regulator [Roseomonas pecuniae]